MEFNYTLEEKDGLAILKIKGNLIEKSQAIPLLEDVEECIMKDINQLILDMTDFRYLNSTGLNIFINILTKARRSGGEVVICSVSPKIKELLIITKLNTIFLVSDHLEDAIKLLNHK